MKLLKKQSKHIDSVYDGMFGGIFGYSYHVRLNKETNKYEFFKCRDKTLSKYNFQDISILNPKLRMDYNVYLNFKGDEKIIEEFKNPEHQKKYGLRSCIFCFINEHFDACELDFPHTVANIAERFGNATIGEILTVIDKVNQKQAKYSQQKKLESSDQKETKISEKIR